jgi:hypothetical protein
MVAIFHYVNLVGGDLKDGDITLPNGIEGQNDTLIILGVKDVRIDGQVVKPCCQKSDKFIY